MYGAGSRHVEGGRGRRRVVTATFLIALIGAACAPAATSPDVSVAPSVSAVTSSPESTTAVSPTPSATPTPATAPTTARSAGRTVFVIVMENNGLDAALRQPYLSTLATQYGVATNYHAVSSPSLPNYLALTSGETFGIEDDDYHQLPVDGIGEQLSTAGITWRAYMEGMGQDCRTDTETYAVKHDPFAYYGPACPANIVPLTALASDLRASTPRLAWITPDVCHDGHDCPLPTADAWLATTVPLITASPAWQAGGVLFIVWDESDGRSHTVPLFVVTPRGGAVRSEVRYDHYSLLATMETLLGVPLLGRAAQATVIADLIPGP